MYRRHHGAYKYQHSPNMPSQNAAATSVVRQWCGEACYGKGAPRFVSAPHLRTSLPHPKPDSGEKYGANRLTIPWLNYTTRHIGKQDLFSDGHCLRSLVVQKAIKPKRGTSTVEGLWRQYARLSRTIVLALPRSPEKNISLMCAPSTRARPRLGGLVQQFIKRSVHPAVQLNGLAC